MNDDESTRLRVLGSPAMPVSWLSPQRPVEGTVFVKPAVEPDPRAPEGSDATA